MEPNVHLKSTFPTSDSVSDTPLNKAVSGAHGVVDKAATAADEVARRAKPVIDRAAETAHQAVDRAASAAAPTADWLKEKGESFNEARQNIVADASRYVAANPFKVLAIALAAGLLIGRIMR